MIKSSRNVPVCSRLPCNFNTRVAAIPHFYHSVNNIFKWHPQVHKWPPFQSRSTIVMIEPCHHEPSSTMVRIERGAIGAIGASRFVPSVLIQILPIYKACRMLVSSTYVYTYDGRELGMERNGCKRGRHGNGFQHMFDSDLLLMWFNHRPSFRMDVLLFWFKFGEKILHPTRWCEVIHHFHLLSSLPRSSLSYSSYFHTFYPTDPGNLWTCVTNSVSWPKSDNYWSRNWLVDIYIF